MNTIKQLRENKGHTQQSLAELSGLSLRTIQRMESTKNTPKGNTLLALSKALNVKPEQIVKQYIHEPQDFENIQSDLKIINLSVLGCFILPFGNIILPFYFWSKKKKDQKVDKLGRKIINFQLMWSLLLCLSLSIAPFLNITILNTPLILVVLFGLLFVNLMVVISTSLRIEQNHSFLNLPIHLI